MLSHGPERFWFFGQTSLCIDYLVAVTGGMARVTESRWQHVVTTPITRDEATRLRGPLSFLEEFVSFGHFSLHVSLALTYNSNMAP